MAEALSFITHSAPEYFEKLVFKKKKNNATLNGCISKARANSESKLTFSESSFNFVQNRQWPAGLKELMVSQEKF